MVDVGPLGPDDARLLDTQPAPGGDRGRSTRARIMFWAASVLVVLALPALLVTAVVLHPPNPPRTLGVIPACEALAGDVVDAGSFGALVATQPRDWALVVGRYRAALAAAWDRGVGDLLDSATLGARSDRRIAALAAVEWCLTSGWLPGKPADDA